MNPVRCWSAVLAFALSLSAADTYVLGPESTNRAPGVPVGRVEAFEFNESKVFPDTTRGGWVYVPAQHDGSKPAALMVFQDGHEYVSDRGSQRVPTVLDNLIAKGDLPPMVAIFINPGHRGTNAPPAAGWGNRSNRSFEYDSLGADYARFLTEELIPWVTNRHRIQLSADPAMRGIAGMSSGGICAFTVAWERPDQFRRVLSQIGSFVNIRGGHVYPALIRKTERKPIRVFLQDGANDLNNLHGDWPLANKEMFSSLNFAGYDVRFVFGDGAHNGRHGGVILPDALRWLWRPVTQPPEPSTNNWAGDEALNKVLPGGGQPGDWELVGEGYGFTDAACSDPDGNVYFSDLPKGVLYRQGIQDAKPVAWWENTPKVSGLKVGPGGVLYAASQGGLNDDPKAPKRKIIALDPVSKAITDIATDVNPNDLAVSKTGWIYFTDTGAGQVLAVPTSARGMSRPRPVAGGINKPNGIALSPRQDMLLVSEYGGTNVWSYLIDSEGGLTGGERYMTLRVPNGRGDSGGDGSTVDELGRAYVTSHAGIQMFDAIGRMGGVIARPQDKATVSCTFGGPGGAWLYVCSSDRVYRRKTLTRAAQ
jgi:gluconolactonase